MTHAKSAVMHDIGLAQAELDLVGDALAWVEKEKDATVKCLWLHGVAEGIANRQAAEKKPKEKD